MSKPQKAKQPKEPFRVLDLKDGKKLAVSSNLDRPEEEVAMIREMLGSQSKSFIPNMGMVEVSDYTGEQRKILSDRLYQLLYTTQDVTPKGKPNQEKDPRPLEKEEEPMPLKKVQKDV